MPKNLGIATDLFFNDHAGTVERRRAYVVVRTASAPEYYSGNMLVLQRRPLGSDLSRIEHDFDELVGKPPAISHKTFSWPDGETALTGLDAYRDAGYDLTHNCVLVAAPGDLGRTVSIHPSIEVRAYHDQNDWDRWTAMHLAYNGAPMNDGIDERYLLHQQSAYKRLIASGLGEWWGAYLNGEQVGSAGLFFTNGVGRFQWVITDEAYRGRNICKTLLREVSNVGFRRAAHLVIVADESHHAGQIYQAIGFKRRQWTASLCREPKPASKAHPGLLVDRLEPIVDALKSAGHSLATDVPVKGFSRVFTNDPFGNRIELLERVVEPD